MNPFIENLNQSGGQFLNFAWPMLWQSSLLIAFVFALDFLLARKIRASVRYALWLAVLVKLILPPTLALPTGAAWWLFQTKPAAAPVTENYTVTYGATVPQMDFVPQTIPMPAPLPPPPKLDGAGWALLASVTVSAGLLLWLAIRWWQVARIVRSAKLPEEFSSALAEARRLADLRSRARLKLVEGRMSPAVCGLFRPVILLPRTLAEKLSAAQLRPVLLHEMFHLRRKDVWVNCAQALLQIFYWWHPLLWFANARIRRVREEAVDDAVMLALRDEADGYAPTLLEVAKLAFHRPLMSLGLVGIMESRSALRQRIERLVDFRAPKKAGLTFAALCGIFVFSAVALPMGEAPAPSENGKNDPVLQSTNTGGTNIAAPFSKTAYTMSFKFYNWKRDTDLTNLLLNAGVKMPPTAFIYTDNGLLVVHGSVEQLALVHRMVLQQNGYSTEEIENGYSAFIKDFSKTKASNETATNLFQRTFKVDVESVIANFKNMGASISKTTNSDREISVAARQCFGRLGVDWDSPAGKSVAFNDRLGYLYVRATESDLDMIEIAILTLNNAAPVTNPYATNDLIYPDPQQTEIKNKLGTYHLSVSYMPAVTLREVVRDLSQKIKASDPEKMGIHFTINNNLNDATSEYTPVAGKEQADIGSQFTIALNLKDARLDVVLDDICMAANHPHHPDWGLRYSIQDDGIVFYGKSPDDEGSLILRTFKVDPNVFSNALRELPFVGDRSTDLQTSPAKMFRDYFTSLGVDLDSPGESIAFEDNMGLFFVRATESDLDTIERVISALNNAAPRNHSIATNSFDDIKNAKLEAKTLVQDGETLYEAGKLEEAQAKLDKALKLDPDSEASFYYKNLIQQAGYNRDEHAHTTAASATNLYATNDLYPGPGRAEIMNKLNSYRLSVSYNPAVPLNEVIRDLRQKIQAMDPRKKPMNFIINNSASPGGTTQTDIGSSLVSLTLDNMRLEDVLDAICKVAHDPNHPDEHIKYSVMDYGIVFSAKKADEVALHERTFKLNPNVFLAKLQIQDGSQTNDVSTSVKSLFKKLGVDWESPNGKAVAYNNHLGMLYVRATESDLDTIERVLANLSGPAPQVHIKAWFVEMPKGTFDGLKKFMVSTNSADGKFMGFLTSQNAKVAIQSLQSTKGAEILGEPEATTASGRQVQMRATKVVTVITNLAFPGTFTNQDGYIVTDAVVPQTAQIERGPVLDVVPYVLPDGYTINLALIPSLIELLDYDKPPEEHISRYDTNIHLPKVLPNFRIRQVVASANLWDGQTLIVGGISATNIITTRDELPPLGDLPLVERLFFRSESKELLIFITATIVDPAGNRIHSDGELPFAQKGVPQQPAQAK